MPAGSFNIQSMRNLLHFIHDNINLYGNLFYVYSMLTIGYSFDKNERPNWTSQPPYKSEGVCFQGRSVI